MNRLLFFCLILLLPVLSCNKDTQTPQYPSYYGQWQWIGSSWGPLYSTPSPDSVVILMLNPGNLYKTTLNDKLSLEGTFQIDSNSNRVTLQFNNINQPAGSQTSVVSGNLTYLFYNYSKIGQMVLYQDNWTSSPGDTLQLIQSPTIPESTTNYFKRIREPQ